MIIITKVINIIGKLSTHKRHYTVIPCVCKRMLFIYFFKRGGLNIFVFDINVGFKKKKQENFPRCAQLHLGLKETLYIGHFSFNEIIFKSKIASSLISNTHHVSVYSRFFDIPGHTCDVSIPVLKVGIKIHLILYGQRHALNAGGTPTVEETPQGIHLPEGLRKLHFLYSGYRHSLEI